MAASTSQRQQAALLQDTIAEPSRPKSEMRRYLEDPNSFKWKDGRTEATFPNNEPLPITYLARLDGKRKSQTASISKYRMDEHKCEWMDFTYCFAVKEILHHNKVDSINTAKREVANMRGLRYPHVVALLGTYQHRERLHIIMYPAASCDLGDLMENISDHYTLSRPDRRLTTSDARRRSPSMAASYQAMAEDRSSTTVNGMEASVDRRVILPPSQSLHDQLAALIRYFVCLCQALAYLHQSDVRHKDIKPENILIDEHGYPLLTDFGISTKFESNASHVTGDERMRTARYQSPEKHSKELRDDSDDIFSLGCVFLEMASIILGEDWQSCKRHFTETINLTGTNDSFCTNLVKLGPWLKHLKSIHNLPQGMTVDNRNAITVALDTVKLMMSPNPQARPPATGLYEKFDFPGQAKCRDCHPATTDELGQLRVQAQEPNDKNTSQRRGSSSMQQIPELPYDANPFPNDSLDPSSTRSLKSLQRDSSVRSGSPRRTHSNGSPRPPHLRAVSGSPLRNSDTSLLLQVDNTRSFQAESVATGHRQMPGIEQNMENNVEIVQGQLHKESLSRIERSDSRRTSPHPVILAQNPPRTAGDRLGVSQQANNSTPNLIIGARQKTGFHAMQKTDSDHGSPSDPSTSPHHLIPIFAEDKPLDKRISAAALLSETTPNSHLESNSSLVRFSSAEEPSKETPKSPGPHHTSTNATTRSDSTVDSAASKNSTYRKEHQRRPSKSNVSMVRARSQEKTRPPLDDSRTTADLGGLEDVTEHFRAELLADDENKVLLCNVKRKKFYWCSVGEFVGSGSAYRIYKMPETGNVHDVYYRNKLIIRLDFGKLGYREDPP